MSLSELIARLRLLIQNNLELSEIQQATALLLLEQLETGRVDQLIAQQQLHQSVFGMNNHFAGTIAARDLVGGDKYEIGQLILQLSPQLVPQLQHYPTDAGIREGVNPFVEGGSVAPADFYGMQIQCRSLRDRIGGRVPQSVSIVGFPRSGKSSLLRYIKERTNEFCAAEFQPVVVAINLRERLFHTPEGITEGLRRGVEHATGSAPWARSDNHDLWAIDDGLRAIRDRGIRLIILIDEFEQIGQRLDQFRNWGDDWSEKASQGYFSLVITTVRPIEYIDHEIGLSTLFGNIFLSLELGAFDQTTWQKLVMDGFRRANTTITAHDLAVIEELGGGLPAYTQLAAYTLWRYPDHQQARTIFRKSCAGYFTILWQSLRDYERHAVRYAAGLPRLVAPIARVQSTLQRHGIIRSDGQLFSTAFSDFVRDQR